jgi:hypothetical protein
MSDDETSVDEAKPLEVRVSELEDSVRQLSQQFQPFAAGQTQPLPAGQVPVSASVCGPVASVCGPVGSVCGPVGSACAPQPALCSVCAVCNACAVCRICSVGTVCSQCFGCSCGPCAS